jgi:NADH-quinone oxidoreductase subunit I
MKEYVGSLFLKELLKGMALTGRHLFARKITVQFPEEKHRKARGFEVCTLSVVTLTEKSVV